MSAHRVAVRTLLVGALLTTVGWWSPTTAHASGATSCNGGTLVEWPVQRCAVAFGLTGGPEVFTVPDGVSSVTLFVKGGNGGGPVMADFDTGDLLPGGRGGLIEAQLDVHPGEQFTVDVGGAGGGTVKRPYAPGQAIVPGGYGGGGNSCAFGVQHPGGEPFEMGGGGGGGGTFVHARTTGELVAAAGGGGGGSSDVKGPNGSRQTGGGNGPAQVYPGRPDEVEHGEGGTQTSPGPGGGGSVFRGPPLRWRKGW